MLIYTMMSWDTYPWSIFNGVSSCTYIGWKVLLSHWWSSCSCSTKRMAPAIVWWGAGPSKFSGKVIWFWGILEEPFGYVYAYMHTWECTVYTIYIRMYTSRHTIYIHTHTTVCSNTYIHTYISIYLYIYIQNVYE